MRPSINKRQKYYFSDKLKAKLSQISQYPLTIIEAPSGFGKTTAIREYLRNKHTQINCEWYTCLGEPAPVAWAGICELFSGIDSEAADGMKKLKMPMMDTLFYIKPYLKNLNCIKKTYLVIDNYQLINFNMHRELINVFSTHEAVNLHMVFIMQPLDSKKQSPVHNDNIYIVDASSFFFDRESICALLRMEGLRLTEKELEDLFRNTQGWISAIRLHLINYKETGSFICPAGIEKLVETAIWNQLAPEEKEFLLEVSVFDSFTAKQASYMMGCEILPGKIEDDLKVCNFMRFLPDQHLFIIHSILLDYLRNRFYYHQSKEYQDKIFHKAGLSCAAIGQYCMAANFFYKIRDFEGIMSLPFTHQYIDLQKEVCDGKLLPVIIQECPKEILCRRPSIIIVFARYALLSDKYAAYEKLCGLLRYLIREEANLSQKEISRLTGELILLESLRNFDLAKMLEGYRLANEISKEAPDIVENSIPWISVFLTTFGMFWQESGKLDEVLSTVEKIKPDYRKFNGGQGAGLAYMIRAEAMLTRGEDNEAEILCHKALYEARYSQQTNICIYAEHCLARIFILRGDTEKFLVAMGNIQRYSKENSDSSISRMVEICMSIISLLLGVKDYVAPWLYDIEEIRQSLYVPAIPFAEILHFRLLLIEKRYNELYALSQLALDKLRSPETKNKYIIPQMYYLIFFAVAKYNTGDDSEAQRYLKEALDLAIPDGVYLPFADHECMISILSLLNINYLNRGKPYLAERYKEILRDFDIPPATNGSRPGNRDLTLLLLLCKRQMKGVSIIRKALIQKKSPLTPREREIALLARDRMSAKEIAAKLYISEATVKSTLRSVYGKLEIHSKNELASVEF